MKVAEGTEMLELTAEVGGAKRIIYPTLIWDNETVILVDSGFPGQTPIIKEAMNKTGIPFEKLNMILVTHHDIDHIGSLSSIQKELQGKIKILAHEEEKPYINGEKYPLKLAHLEVNFNTLPDEMKAFYERLKIGFQQSRADVDQTLADGEQLPYCGGITVIFTPGHTLGHICFYLQQSKTLIAGDLLHLEYGNLVMGKPSMNHDTKMCKESLKRLANYDINSVICYHGGLYKGEVNRRIQELAQS